MKAVTFKLCLLSLVVLFSQCATFHFTDRKYTKGRYHDKPKELTVNSRHAKAPALPDIEVKTEISASDKTPVEKAPDDNTITAGTDHLPGTLPQASVNSLPKAPLKSAPLSLSEKTAKVFSRLPFTSTLLSPKKAPAKGDGGHFTSTILSIIGFAAGVISIIIAIIAIFDSFAIEAVSGFFYMAIVIGLLAIACGIVALVLGHGDLDRFEKTFSVLAIALGGAGLLIALIWSFLVAALITA